MQFVFNLFVFFFYFIFVVESWQSVRFGSSRFAKVSLGFNFSERPEPQMPLDINVPFRLLTPLELKDLKETLLNVVASALIQQPKMSVTDPTIQRITRLVKGIAFYGIRISIISEEFPLVCICDPFIPRPGVHPEAGCLRALGPQHSLDCELSPRLGQQPYRLPALCSHSLSIGLISFVVLCKIYPLGAEISAARCPLAL